MPAILRTIRSLVWPDDRKTIDVGTISVTSVVADSDAAEKALVFFPTNLTDGIELSDDPLPVSTNQCLCALVRTSPAAVGGPGSLHRTRL